MLFTCGLKIKIMKRLAIIYLLFLFAGCNNEEKTAQDKLLHNQLQVLEVEIELHIVNNELDSASSKLKRLIHPSSEISTIRYEDDLTTKEGWAQTLNRSSSNYRYDEYWSVQRATLLKKINASK
mgnify:CR=1 FL=1